MAHPHHPLPGGFRQGRVSDVAHGRGDGLKFGPSYGTQPPRSELDALAGELRGLLIA